MLLIDVSRRIHNHVFPTSINISSVINVHILSLLIIVWYGYSHLHLIVFIIKKNVYIEQQCQLKQQHLCTAKEVSRLTLRT